MARRPVLVVALLCGCAERGAPPPDYAHVRDLLARLQVQIDTPGHGPYHKANNGLQKALWESVTALPPGPETDGVLLSAAETVYTRYDENYYNGILWHWPYLSSRRAIDLCDRILKSTKDSETRERALWIKAFALRCPATEPWDEAEHDLETYAEQVKWKPDYDAAREIYKQIAREYPDTARGKAAARILAAPDVSMMLPKGPREKDPRNPDNY